MEDVYSGLIEIGVIAKETREAPFLREPAGQWPCSVSRVQGPWWRFSSSDAGAEAARGPSPGRFSPGASAPQAAATRAFEQGSRGHQPSAPEVSPAGHSKGTSATCPFSDRDTCYLVNCPEMVLF